MQKLLLSIFIFCQLIFSSQTGSLTDMQRTASRVSEEYERDVYRALLRYYEPGSFLVDVRTVLDSHEVERRVPVRLPQNTKQLPGLPFVPQGMVQENIETFFEQVYSIGRVTVTVLLDSSYSFDRDYEFITNVIVMAAKIDIARGDQVVLRRQQFPPSNLDSNPPQREVVVGETSIASAEEGGIPWKWILLGALVGIVSILIFKRANTQKNSGESTEMKAALSKIVDEINSVKSEISQPREPLIETNERAKLSSFVINAFAGSPKQATEILLAWIDENREEGSLKSGALLRETNGDLLSIIKPFTSDSLYRALEWHTEHSQIEGDTIEIFKQFKRDFGLFTKDKGDGDKGEKALFGFLKQLSIEQLEHLLKGEQIGVQALILSQVDGDIAAVVLQKLSESDRVRILVSMGHIDSVPLSIYKAVAEKLSQKALKLSSMRSVPANGIDATYKILASLQTPEQTSYINAIASADIMVAHQIRRFFIPFSELFTLEKDMLRKLFQNIPRESFGIACVGLKDEEQEKLLSAFPERMQEMIKSEISTHFEATPSDIEYARKNVLKTVSEELRKMGGRVI